jgi:predicted DNA-binding transcriptional regulator AlpA
MNLQQLYDRPLIVQVSLADLRQDRAELIKELTEKHAKELKQAKGESEKLLTTDDVSGLLGVTRLTLWTWRKKGLIEPIRLGNLLRYRQSDIQTLIEKRSEKQA